ATLSRLSFLSSQPPTLLTLFPYTTLFRSGCVILPGEDRGGDLDQVRIQLSPVPRAKSGVQLVCGRPADAFQQVVCLGDGLHDAVDRKSTRLNSSHVKISYAVFCLKKKKIQ